MTASSPMPFPILEANPGIDWLMRFESEDGGADLELDVAEALALALEAAGIAADRDGGRLTLDDGLVLQPLFLEGQAGDDRVQTVTTLQCNHPDLLPDGVFEYQHAVGVDLHDAIGSGFRQWLALDLHTLRDALCETREGSLTMRFDLADGRSRRAVFGPFARYSRQPPEAGSEAAEEAETFCPCCLFTNSMSAMQALLERKGTLGIRLYAARDADGQALADCRVNGMDYPEGAEALRAYVARWPALEGYQFRKQYVILHDCTPGESMPDESMPDESIRDRNRHHPLH
jgi:Family of unknown function (DUF6348)